MMKLFSDFDNTITVGDVHDALFKNFGGQLTEKYDQQYWAGTLSSKECLKKKCASCGEVGLSALNAFLDGCHIDPTFPDCMRFVRAHRLEFSIVSDGFDYTIRHILRKNGLSDIPVFSNKLRFEQDGGARHERLIPSFPFDDEDCTRCACCKRNVMLTHAGEEDIIVYIGDGYSDQCAVQYADIIFAKAELQTFCQRENISYYEFRSFRDIQARLEQLLQKRRLRKRQAAEANRQALFLAG